MPQTSESMLSRLGLTMADIPNIKNFNISQELSALEAGHPFTVGEALFERITPEKVEELKQKYGSSK